VSFHFFPEESDNGGGDNTANIKLYPEMQKREKRSEVSLAVKRGIDVVGSLAALFFFPRSSLQFALAIS